jgi:hypothetical protein
MSWTLGNNFNPAMLEVGIPAAWQVLALGLLFALGAAGSEALRVKAGSLEARQIGQRKPLGPHFLAGRTAVNRPRHRSALLYLLRPFFSPFILGVPNGQFVQIRRWHEASRGRR